MELEELRERIREKDLEIVRLVSERTKLAYEIGDIKIEKNIPLRNTEVEKKVIARYIEEGKKEGLEPAVMRQIASSVIQSAVDAEGKLMKKGCGKRIAIVGGAGKMGHWFADMMWDLGNEIVVVDPSAEISGTIDDCSKADIVMVCVPIHITKDVLEQLRKVCNKDTLIFDMSSLKTPISDTLKEMAKDMTVCSIHPMFGPSASSLYDRNLIICDCGNKEAVRRANELFDDKGANITVMEVDKHDDYMSYVLGLTHAVNIALFTSLERSGYSFDELRKVSSTTFNKGLDTNMSVASEDPTLYYEIQHMNANRERMWKVFSDAVEDVKEASLSDDPEMFRKIMDKGREYFREEKE